VRSWPGVPAPLAEVVEMLGSLPGIGPKTALRLGLNLLRRPAGEVEALASALACLHQQMGYCERCGCFAEHGNCSNCAKAERDQGLVCVVEQPVDVLMLDRSHFSGSYHVLHGRLSPVDGVGPEQLRLAPLDRRVSEGHVDEMILATSATVDGEATAHFLARRYVSEPIRISRIARGVPEGGELEYLDEYTIGRALDQRITWEQAA